MPARVGATVWVVGAAVALFVEGTSVSLYPNGLLWLCADKCLCLVRKSSGEKLGTINLLPMPVDLEDTDWDLVEGDAIPEGDIEVGYILICLDQIEIGYSSFDSQFGLFDELIALLGADIVDAE